MQTSDAGLYDLDQGARFQDPQALEQPYITRYRTDLPRKHQRLFQTIWDGVESQNGEWLAARKIVGYQSLGPKKFIDQAWDRTVEVFGHDPKTINIALGALLKWTVASYAVQQGEIWLCQKTRDAELKIDPITGKVIEYTAYWLDKGLFVPPPRKIKRAFGSLDLSGLKGAWGAR